MCICKVWEKIKVEVTRGGVFETDFIYAKAPEVFNGKVNNYSEIDSYLESNHSIEKLLNDGFIVTPMLKTVGGLIKGKFCCDDSIKALVRRPNSLEPNLIKF